MANPSSAGPAQPVPASGGTHRPQDVVAPPADEWLRQLHSSYLTRHAADNQRIWFVASIFIPLSLATFPALFSVKDLRLIHVIVFGLVSITLIGFWFLVAERHRIFQSDLLRTALELETLAVRGTTGEDLIRRAHATSRRRWPPRVRSLRVALVTVIVAGWVALLIAFAAGALT